jgi:FixJ family two-component response regulator
LAGDGKTPARNFPYHPPREMAPQGEKQVAKMLQYEAASAMAIRQETIAVVDDDPSILKALGRLLTICGYRVQLFGSAEEFLANVASDAAFLIVDCQLGERSGVELSRELAAKGFRFAIIFMTGSEDEGLRKQAIEAGCVGFLKKPFDERQLREFIAKAILASSRSNDA